MKIGLLILFVFFSSLAHAQGFDVDLSPKHQRKLESIKSGHKRMIRYYKYFKKDSVRQFNQLKRDIRRSRDSIRLVPIRGGVGRSLQKREIINYEIQSDSVVFEINELYGAMSDSTISDSVRSAAQDRLKELTLAKAKQYPGFQHLKDQYDIQGDSINWIQLTKQVPGLDTLSDLFDSNPEELFQYAEKMAADKLTQAGNLGILSEQMNDAEALTKLPDQYMDQYAKYTDKEYLQEQAKMKAVEEAVDHFAEHADQLQAAQQKVSKLLSKYKEFSNSSDLSTAVKRTSLKGSTLWERLVVGGNFNVISTDPLSVDLSPQLGYKFTTRFNVGISASYRYTHNDTIRHGWYVSPSNTAIKMFSNYDIIRNFFVTAEWELSGVKAVKNDLVQKDWISNYFVGAGKKLLIHPKVYMTITALYNLNNKDFNSAYPRRFQVKIGFQLSELAMRKKKIYYDPNR